MRQKKEEEEEGKKAPPPHQVERVPRLPDAAAKKGKKKKQKGRQDFAVELNPTLRSNPNARRFACAKYGNADKTLFLK